VKNTYLKNGKNLEIRIGIHTGQVSSAVVGETKPQFSLFGETVLKTVNISRISEPQRVSVSKNTHHYLELYTNNYWFHQSNIEIKG